MTTAIITTFAIATAAIFGALLTSPRWFARSLHMHRLWRLRDALILEVAQGKLDPAHPAVVQTIQQMNMVLRNGENLTILDMYMFRWAIRGADQQVVDRVLRDHQDCGLDGLREDQAKKLAYFREEMTMLVAGTLLLGSWTGIAHVLRFLGPAIREARAEARAADETSALEYEVRATVAHATERAVSDTALGRYSRQQAEVTERFAASASHRTRQPLVHV